MKDKFQLRTEFEIGESAMLSKGITENDVVSFAEITGDYNPLHMDLEFATKTRFKGRIVHGILSAGLISAVLSTKLPGPGCIYLSQNLQFLHPVRIGDALTAEVEVTDWNPAKRIVHLETRCFNQEGEKVVTGEAMLLVDPPLL